MESADVGGTVVGESESQPGVGIAGMRERLAQVGGLLAVNFHPDGSTVCARIPLL